MGKQICSREDGHQYRNIFRRFPIGCGVQGETRAGSGGNKENIWGARYDIIDEEAYSCGQRSRVSRFQVGRTEEGIKCDRAEAQEIQERSKEFIETTPANHEMESGGRKIAFPKRSSRVHVKAFAKHFTWDTREKKEIESRGCWRGERRPYMVVQGLRNNTRSIYSQKASIGLSGHRCIKGRIGVCPGNPRSTSNKGANTASWRRGPHKQARTLGVPASSGGECRGIKRKKDSMVCGQFHSSSNSKETRNTTHSSRHLGGKQKDVGFTGIKEHRSCGEESTWSLKWCSRQAIEARFGRSWLGESNLDNHREMGPIGKRHLKFIQTPRRIDRRCILGRIQSLIETTGGEDPGGSGYIIRSTRQNDKRRAAVNMGKYGGNYYPFVEGNQMVAEAERNKTRLGEFRQNIRHFTPSMGTKEWASACVDSLFDRYPNKVLGGKTLGTYRGFLTNFLYWWAQEHGDSHGKIEDFTAEDVLQYAQYLAEFTSGENLYVQGKTISNFLFGKESSQEREEVFQQIAKLRRDANTANPPTKKVASPLTIKDIVELENFARHGKITQLERQALDVLIIAFASMSRVGEIANLRLQDVDPCGTHIEIRAKTDAATGKRMVKKVSDWGQ